MQTSGPASGEYVSTVKYGPEPIGAESARHQWQPVNRLHHIILMLSMNVCRWWELVLRYSQRGMMSMSGWGCWETSSIKRRERKRRWKWIQHSGGFKPALIRWGRELCINYQWSYWCIWCLLYDVLLVSSSYEPWDADWLYVETRDSL